MFTNLAFCSEQELCGSASSISPRKLVLIRDERIGRRRERHEHFKERMWERYRLRIDDADVTSIIELIESGASKILESQPRNVYKLELPYRGKLVLMVYSRSNKRMITALDPRNYGKSDSCLSNDELKEVARKIMMNDATYVAGFSKSTNIWKVKIGKRTWKVKFNWRTKKVTVLK